jgi:hypothetical protein
MLVSDVITSALSRIGVIPIGGAVPAEWTTIAIPELSRLLQHWAAVNLIPSTVAKSTATLTAGTAIYIIGSGEALNIARPTRIQAASVSLNSVETPCDVSHGVEGYAGIPSKDVRGRPSSLFYDPGITKGTVILSPVPDGAYTLALWAVSSLAAVTGAGDTVAVPLDFEHVVTVVFAAHLASMWGKTDAFLAQEALMALDAVKTKPRIFKVPE